MSEHSVEELDRQYQAAVSRRDLAQKEAEAAFSKLQQARLEATGLAGHLVRGSRWDQSPTYTFLAERIAGYRNDTIQGRVIKKGGSIGLQGVEVPILRLTDLGPYTQPEPTP